MMAVAVVFFRPMVQLLDDRTSDAARALTLKCCMGDVIVMVQHLLEITDYLALAQAIVWFDVNMCRKSRNM